MLTILRALKVYDKFIDLNDLSDIVYTVRSEPIDDEVLCTDDEGFAEMFSIYKIVRPVR